VLLAISREFGKCVDWLLTGKAHMELKQQAAQENRQDLDRSDSGWRIGSSLP
jgi:hypothetical protein